MNTDFTTTRAKFIDKLVSFVINQTFGSIESNKEEFNKEAYLDLSKPYTHKQSNTTKKDNQASLSLLSLLNVGVN
jgi:hypothetical protein